MRSFIFQISGAENDPTFFGAFTEEHFKSKNGLALMNFVIAVEQQFNLFKHFQTDCLFEISFLATHFEYGKKSIGKALCEYSIQLAKEIKHGQCRYLLKTELRESHYKPAAVSAIFTSKLSQRVGESMGLSTLFRSQYNEYVYDGKTVAELIKNPLNVSSNIAALKI